MLPGTCLNQKEAPSKLHGFSKGRTFGHTFGTDPKTRDSLLVSATHRGFAPWLFADTNEHPVRLDIPMNTERLL